MHPVIRALCLSIVTLVSSDTALAASMSNLEREKAWADQIVDYLVAGDAVWLSASGTRFLSLYTQPGRKSRQGVILLHGRGVHPAWGFIDNLRVDLVDAGFHTLSLQMPILNANVKLSDYDKTFPEAFTRIDAGVKYLRQRGVTKIFLIGHSTGATTAVSYSADHAHTPLAGIAVIELLTEPTGGPRLQAAQALAKIKIPVLDIYGADSLPVVLQTAAQRANAARRAGNSAYTQERIDGANHFFTGRYEQLHDNVRTWLNKHAK